MQHLSSNDQGNRNEAAGCCSLAMLHIHGTHNAVMHCTCSMTRCRHIFMHCWLPMIFHLTTVHTMAASTPVMDGGSGECLPWCPVDVMDIVHGLADLHVDLQHVGMPATAHVAPCVPGAAAPACTNTGSSVHALCLAYLDNMHAQWEACIDPRLPYTSVLRAIMSATALLRRSVANAYACEDEPPRGATPLGLLAHTLSSGGGMTVDCLLRWAHEIGQTEFLLSLQSPKAHLPSQWEDALRGMSACVQSPCAAYRMMQARALLHVCHGAGVSSAHATELCVQHLQRGNASRAATDAQVYVMPPSEAGGDGVAVRALRCGLQGPGAAERALSALVEILRDTVRQALASCVVVNGAASAASLAAVVPVTGLCLSLAATACGGARLCVQVTSPAGNSGSLHNMVHSPGWLSSGLATRMHVAHHLARALAAFAAAGIAHNDLKPPNAVLFTKTPVHSGRDLQKHLQDPQGAGGVGVALIDMETVSVGTAAEVVAPPCAMHSADAQVMRVGMEKGVPGSVLAVLQALNRPWRVWQAPKGGPCWRVPEMITWQYAAPERLVAGACAGNALASDVYSAAVVVAEVLSGYFSCRVVGRSYCFKDTERVYECALDAMRSVAAAREELLGSLDPAHRPGAQEVLLRRWGAGVEPAAATRAQVSSLAERYGVEVDADSIDALCSARTDLKAASPGDWLLDVQGDDEVRIMTFSRAGRYSLRSVLAKHRPLMVVLADCWNLLPSRRPPMSVLADAVHAAWVQLAPKVDAAAV